ncbi:MAG: PIN/TRAM domain-containing protein [Anaerolineae bacterium]
MTNEKIGEDSNTEKNVSELPLRLLGGFVCMLLGASLTSQLGFLSSRPTAINVIALGLLGFLFGLILTPLLTVRPLRFARRRLVTMTAAQLTAVIFGILLGLLAGGLFSIPLAFLPSPFQQIFPLISVLIFTYFSVFILYQRQADIGKLLSGFRMPDGNGNGSASATTNMLAVSDLNGTDHQRVILLDTSVIIDGRISDISKTGFLRDTILIPTFILRELQHIADSSDAIRRNRGRRGLEVLGMLQQESLAPIEITDMDASEVRDADSKLVALAKQIPCPILTNDYNLNRVAELQGVNVMNINDLANAVKVAYLPGEDLVVKIIQEGREVGQGIGYLEDGTMVVVEEGMDRMHKTSPVIVTKVLQTSAGRMVFARFPTDNESDMRS